VARWARGGRGLGSPEHARWANDGVLTRTVYLQPHHLIPSDRLQSLDQIGRAVVEQLVLEGLAATQGGATWRAWVHRQGKKWLPAKWTATRNANATSDAMASSGEAEEGAEARAMGLGRRLKIDEWGSRMLGQEMHFRDEVHPAPLPGSWLYGNMAMASHTHSGSPLCDGVGGKHVADAPVTLFPSLGTAQA